MFPLGNKKYIFWSNYISDPTKLGLNKPELYMHV